MYDVKYTQEQLQEMRDRESGCLHADCAWCNLDRAVLAERAPTLIPTDAQAQSSGALKR